MSRGKFLGAVARVCSIIGAPVAELARGAKFVCTVAHLTWVPAVVAETNAGAEVDAAHARLQPTLTARFWAAPQQV